MSRPFSSRYCRRFRYYSNLTGRVRKKHAVAARWSCTSIERAPAHARCGPCEKYRNIINIFAPSCLIKAASSPIDIIYNMIYQNCHPPLDFKLFNVLMRSPNVQLLFGFPWWPRCALCSGEQVRASSSLTFTVSYSSHQCCCHVNTFR